MSTSTAEQASDNSAIFNYALRLGDTTMVLAQRYCEWVGRAPTIEEELALANVGLDTLGQAMAWLDVASQLDVNNRTPDDLAYFRNEREYTNYLIAELENGDFAMTTLRGYFMSSYLFYLYQSMKNSSHESFRAIAIKSLKEVEYHRTHQHTWLIRLGNGTQESHQRLQHAINDSWAYTKEMFEEDAVIEYAQAQGIIGRMADVEQAWRADMTAMIADTGLSMPQSMYHHSGGTRGVHTEYLGRMLAEMQSLKREMPDLV